MSCLGNVIWFIFGGLIGGLSWLAAGVLWCITIIGIPSVCSVLKSPPFLLRLLAKK